MASTADQPQIFYKRLKSKIILGQVENASDMTLEVWVGRAAHRVVAEGAITEGETADRSAGVDPDGLMWIGKDGAVLAETAGELPEDMDRANLLAGSSNWAEDDALVGDISAISVTDHADVSDLSIDPVDPSNPDAPSDPGLWQGGDMILVAHQDGDLLFMNPTILELIDGDDPVTTVYLTSGDFGLADDYRRAREKGEKGADAEMEALNEAEEGAPLLA